MNDIDIVARLNALAVEPHRVWLSNMVCEAADEIDRLRAALAARDAQRCGTCAYWTPVHDGVGFCDNGTSACNSQSWPPDHGCPYWRPKEGA